MPPWPRGLISSKPPMLRGSNERRSSFSSIWTVCGVISPWLTRSCCGGGGGLPGPLPDVPCLALVEQPLRQAHLQEGSAVVGCGHRAGRAGGVGRGEGGGGGRGGAGR